jgi:hypothetical protein
VTSLITDAERSKVDASSICGASRSVRSTVKACLVFDDGTRVQGHGTGDRVIGAETKRRTEQEDGRDRVLCRIERLAGAGSSRSAFRGGSRADGPECRLQVEKRSLRGRVGDGDVETVKDASTSEVGLFGRDLHGAGADGAAEQHQRRDDEYGCDSENDEQLHDGHAALGGMVNGPCRCAGGWALSGHVQLLQDPLVLCQTVTTPVVETATAHRPAPVSGPE